MRLLTKGILLKVENIYEKEVIDGKKQDVYQGFKPEGVVVLSSVEGVKKGETVQVNPYGGSEIQSLSTKKNRFLVIEERDLLIAL